MSGYVDAWLPPIPFLSLDARGGAIAPLVHLERGGQAAYESVLIVPRSSQARSVEDVFGKRAAWVEPSSASGVVVPRLTLMTRSTRAARSWRSASGGRTSRSCAPSLEVVPSHDGRSRLLARDAFGVDAFRPFAPEGYENLRRAVARATSEGLLPREPSIEAVGDA